MEAALSAHVRLVGSPRSARVDRIAERSRSNEAAHSGSYGTTTTGSAGFALSRSMAAMLVARWDGSKSTYGAAGDECGRSLRRVTRRGAARVRIEAPRPDPG